MTGVDFADYELHVEFKAPATTNAASSSHASSRPIQRRIATNSTRPSRQPLPHRFPVGREKTD
jgi:hypothetical protein